MITHELLLDLNVSPKNKKNIMRYYINLPVLILFKWIYNGTKIARTGDLCFTKNTVQ
jgi:hypothetical protein